MPVVNKRTHKPTNNDVYIGRPSRLGNPFVVGPQYSRIQAVTLYRKWLEEQLLEDPSLKEYLISLKDKNLVCWCAPELCHGDIIEEIIERLIK